MRSIYVCHSASCTNRANTVWILIRAMNPTQVAENICSCWRSLCSCNSILAHRVLMAGPVPPQRLPKKRFHRRATSLLPHTSRWDISLKTSSMQRCEMSQFFTVIPFYDCGLWRSDNRHGRGKIKAHWPWYELWLIVGKIQPTASISKT